MSDSEKLLGLAFGIATPDPKVVTVPDAMQGDEDALPNKFKRNTHLALDKAAEILTIKLDSESPNYGTELRAITAASGAQINAQLKSDETTVKVERHCDMTELLERIKAAEIKGRALQGLPPLTTEQLAQGREEATIFPSPAEGPARKSSMSL